MLMILHAMAMSISYVFSKELNQSLHPFQVAFLYKFAILICIVPWCFYGDYKKNLKTKRLGMHVARGTFSLLGTLCFFVAVKGISISNATAITCLEKIIIVLIGVFYFKEKLTHAKLTLVICAVCGALLIIKPGFIEFNHYYIYLFLALFFWASNTTVIKVLGSTERTKAQLFYVMLFSSLFSLPMALYEWKPIEPWHIKLILGAALCYLIHTVAFFKAFKFAEMSTVMPFDYTRLIFSGMLGFFILGEVPDQYSLYGYVLIISGGLYALHYETLKKRKATKANNAKLEAEYEHI
jgi:S-adenosylmethionine uptake transporter